MAIQANPHTVATLHDTASGVASRIDSILDDSAPCTPLQAPTLPHASNMATLFTSGSRSQFTAWPKTAAQLLGEALMVSELFGISAGSRIVSSVLPMHMYGLLFTLLAPLCRGAAFLRENVLHNEAIAGKVERYAADILVTVPIHLRALTAVDTNTLRSLRTVFSSTGPLSDNVARTFTTRHGKPITEILGSTETGGFAFRSRQNHTRWQTFPNVNLSSDDEGHLLIDSPFVDQTAPRPFQTADLAKVHEDGTFEHLGRSDDVIKVGGMRVSLLEMEERLRKHPAVQDVAVLAINQDHGRGHRLFAVVVAPEHTIPALSQALRERFTQSVLPRFLCVDVLPRESNGKLRRSRLLRLLSLTADGTPIQTKLTFEELPVTAPDKRTFQTQIPERYSWFDGHFPGYPILAGAVQLKELVLPTLYRAFSDLSAVLAMKRIKFSGRIMPGDHVSVALCREDHTIHFEIHKGDVVCSAGSLVFESQLSQKTDAI